MAHIVDTASKPVTYEINDLKSQGQIEHIEGAAEYVTDNLKKSRFDNLSIPRSLWVFRRSVLVTLAVYTGYMCEGFEVSQGMSTQLILARCRWIYRRECWIHPPVRYWWYGCSGT